VPARVTGLSLLERKRLLEVIVSSGISPAQLLVGNGFVRYQIRPGCARLADRLCRRPDVASVLLRGGFHRRAFRFLAEFIDRDKAGLVFSNLRRASDLVR
jgi:hypothetical protein